MSALTSKIDFLLLKKQVRRADLSRATGINESTMRNWSRRETMPQADDLYKIAKYFGVSMEFFMDDVKLEEVVDYHDYNPEEPYRISNKKKPDEKEEILLKKFETLTDEDRKMITEIIENLYYLAVKRYEAKEAELKIQHTLNNYQIKYEIDTSPVYGIKHVPDPIHGGTRPIPTIEKQFKPLKEDLPPQEDEEDNDENLKKAEH